jgi:probable O-glycosylation ligase (exosortase A-associated)
MLGEGWGPVSLRDLLLSAVILGLLPAAVMHPWVGAMLWTWVGLMNPHRQTWGFAYDMPFAQLIAIAIFIGLFVSRDPKRLPWTPITFSLLLLNLWFCLSHLFAVFPAAGFEMFTRVLKIQVMLFVTLAVLHTRRHLDILVWVIVVSIGFYGVKGGIYTLMTGGGGRVWGPTGSFIEGNNELAVANLMIIPLMVYLYRQSSNRWVRLGLVGAALATCLAVLGSQSRGAFLAAGAMLFFLWLHTKNKILTLIPMVMLSAAALAFMPEKWWDRMETIRTYEEDGSALGRLNAWGMAFNLANDRLGLGAGYSTAHPELFLAYAPDKSDVPRAAHSIYFQVLGEHGWIGLIIFMLLWALTWLGAGALQREARRVAESAWAADLGSMVKVSLVAFFVGGAFLSLAYFDLPYLLAALVVVARRVLADRRACAPAASPAVVAPRPTADIARTL